MVYSMRNGLIVALADELDEYVRIAGNYGVGFEINDFCNPELLDNETEINAIIQKYKTAGIPKNSTMHGVFYDIILFSLEPKVRELAKSRMRQSMDIAKELGLKGVVFHTNYMPALAGEVYDKNAIDCTVQFLKVLLEDYPGIQIYLENMFDDSPKILMGIAKQLKDYSNFGICLDYSHCCIFSKDKDFFIKNVAPYVKHLHINDNDLSRDLHLAVGDGLIEWENFVQYYRQCFSDASILIETTKPKDQIKSLEFIKYLSL